RQMMEAGEFHWLRRSRQDHARVEAKERSTSPVTNQAASLHINKRMKPQMTDLGQLLRGA
ncbi:MAG: hypothetical protein WCK89_24600, partial [bacterium]